MLYGRFRADSVVTTGSAGEAILWRQVGQILFALDALDRRKPQDRARRFRIGRRQTLPPDGGDDY